MKRLTALLLTAIMVFTIIPASFLSASAHGRGVAQNNRDNLSIDNAPGQIIPSTVVVDGSEDDTGWDHDDWQTVNAGTGIWDAVYYRSSDFTYKYQLHSDYQYLYGIVKLDINDIYNGTLNDVTIWLNSDTSVKSYTAKLVFSASNVTKADGTLTPTIYFIDGTTKAFDTLPAGNTAIEKSLYVVKNDNGVITVEFRCLTEVLCGEAQKTMTAYVSVGTHYADGDVTQNLYHPRFDAEIDGTGIDPTKAWPANASEITQREIYALPNADYSKVLPNEMVIDGEFKEGVWAPFTTMYTEGLDRFEYRDKYKDNVGGFPTIDFSNVKYHLVDKFDNKIPWQVAGDSTGTPIKYKYDVRYDGKYLYGAVVVYCDISHVAKAFTPAGESAAGRDTSLYLTVGTSKLNAGYTNGTAGTSKILVINNNSVAKVAPYDSSKYSFDYQKGTTPTFDGHSIKEDGYKDIIAGSNRIDDYLVEYEFQIPLSKLIQSGDTGDYGFVLSVNAAPYDLNTVPTWFCTNSPVTSSWGGCKNLGNIFNNRKTNIDTEGWSANGKLEAGRWTAIKAADNKIDYGSRDTAGANHVTGTSSNSNFKTEHMAYQIAIDGDYMYGIALIEDASWGENKNFNLWINNGTPRWGDVYDNKLAFALTNAGETTVLLTNSYRASSEFYNGSENILTGVYNALRAQGKTHDQAIAYLTDAETGRGFSGTGNINPDDSSVLGYGTKWLMHPTNAVRTQGVEAVMRKIDRATTDSTGKAVTEKQILLEFKIPLEMLCVTETEEAGIEDYAFTYVASVGSSDGTAKEMVHPMMSNRNISRVDERVFDNTRWNTGSAKIQITNGRYTNNVPDGKLQEEYWDTVDELIKVDGATGEWQKPPQGDDHVDYSYRVFTGREWLYGAAQINAAALANNTKFTIYFNNKVQGSNLSNVATGYMEIKLDEDMEPVVTIKSGDGKNYSYSGFISDDSALHGEVKKAVVPFLEKATRYDIVDPKSKQIDKSYGYASMKTINGVTYVEFKLNLDKYVVDNSGKTAFKFNDTIGTASDGVQRNWTQDKNIDTFYIEPREKIEYVVSVEQDGNILFHNGGDDYQLWATGVNPAANAIGNWGGYIINQDIASHVKPDGWTYILMCPSEIENVYKIEAINWLGVYDESTEAAWNKWQNTYIPNLHDGAILYKLIDVDGATYPEHLQWSLNEGHKDTGILDKILNADKYVRFTNFNPLGNTFEEVFTQMGNKDTPYTLRGYATSATFEPFEFPGDDLNKVQNGVTQYPDKSWTFTTDYTVEPLKNFAPENIIVDGYLDDAGWAEDKWIHVSNDVNGNLQNPGSSNTKHFEYDYQIRTDGEYVYIAAIMDRDPDFDNPEEDPTWYSGPHFRIWIQSQGEGYDYNGSGAIDANEKFDDAVSFTHFFDIQLGAEKDPNAPNVGEFGYSRNKESVILVNKYSYKNDNLSFEPLRDSNTHISVEDSVTATEYNGQIKLHYKGVSLRYGTHFNMDDNEGWWDRPNGGNAQTDGTKTTWDIYETTNKFGQDSVFYGERNTVLENTVEGVGNSYTSDSWYAQPEVTKYTYGKEHASYNTTKDGKKAVVEFKFALADIGTDSEHGFKYYVQGSSGGRTTSNAFVLFHPHFTVEPDTGASENAYTNYHLPFWVWGENAFYCDKQWFYDNMLNNPKEPVLPLGGQTVEDYEVNDKTTWSSAVRFGVLYDADYLDEVYGKTDWTGAENIYKDATYWDVKEIGLVLGVSQRLQLKGTDVELYTDTKYPGTNTKVNYVDSDSIIHRVDDTNMADYSSYIYYAVTNTSGHENDKLTFRGAVEYYPYDDIYYDHDIPTKLPNDQSGHSFRPTYYSNVLTRSYNMIKQGSQKYGNSSNMPGLDRPIVQINKVDYANGIKVAYIPLDNRPVNYQRVQYLAQSVGIDLLMPPEDLFKNTLDNNDTDPNNNTRSDSGNPLQLLNWLKNEASAASYYVLSLDMLFSGGLIGSRAAEVDKDYDDDATEKFVYRDGETIIENYTIGTVDPTTGMYVLSEGERAIIDYLADLAAREDKYVVYFDTVMRLASTTYYGDYTINDYNALRGDAKTGFAAIERKQLYGKDLTLENIFAGYNKDADDNVISSDGTFTYNGITTDKIDEYLKNRKRKLTIINKLLQTPGKNGKRTADNIDKLILGADDSSNDISIQTNELRYLEEKLLGDNENVVVMAAADELGQLGISDVTTAIYGQVNVNVQYFGAGKDKPADEYDRGNLASTVKAHVKAAGGYYDYNQDGGLDVLILTRTDMADGVKGYNATEYATLVSNVKTLLAKAQANINANIPTCIVDASGDKGEGTLSAYMFGTNFKNYSHVGSDVAKYALTDVGLLLGYSEWNTVANALGISLGNAIARYTYLQNSAEITTESNYGFMKNITHAFVKDIAYREFGVPEVAGATVPELTYNVNTGESSKQNAAVKFYELAPYITDKINASEIYVGEIGTAGSRVEPFTEVKVSDLYFPWERHFEADFNITFSSKASANIAGNGSYEFAESDKPIWSEDKQDWIYANEVAHTDKILTDGEAQNVEYGYGNDANWSRFTNHGYYGGMENRHVTFTFDQAIDAGYVRVHLLAPNKSIAGIQMPYSILVAGSNDMTNWTQIGAIEPSYVDNANKYDSDNCMPNGNSKPDQYYRFWPEATLIGSRTEGTVTTDLYGVWATVPLNGYAEQYKYIRIYIQGWGATYLNEIEIYEADSNYDASWILSGEEVYIPESVA
ncbi:MAG: DUF4127 family protein [Clostridia bacterium]|nr:DUF4127 family protein [Clostridia bacterium]